jgi:microcystin degradation protein MlrC
MEAIGTRLIIWARPRGCQRVHPESLRGPPTTAALDVDDVKVILISYRCQTLDPEMIRLVGLDPRRGKIVVVTSTIHYRAAFEADAKEIIEVDAPGLSSSDLARFPFRRIRRPIFPLDAEATYP